MQYRENPGNKDQLSILGYGCLRYSKKGTAIDQEKAEREMAAAVEAGVNYFDTAYTYGGSEACLGKFLAKGYRDKVKIATKLPHYYIKAEGDMERYFKEQLERLQTDHVEYYLMHMLNDIAAWERLTALGIQDWIAEKKKNGQIGNIGFSFHGGATQFKKIIDSYDWDFCQIQYNYMDEHTQAGTEGLKYAAAYFSHRPADRGRAGVPAGVCPDRPDGLGLPRQAPPRPWPCLRGQRRAFQGQGPGLRPHLCALHRAGDAGGGAL